MTRVERWVLLVMTVVTAGAGAEVMYYALVGNAEAAVLAAALCGLGFMGGAVLLLPRRG